MMNNYFEDHADSKVNSEFPDWQSVMSEMRVAGKKWAEIHSLFFLAKQLEDKVFTMQT